MHARYIVEEAVHWAIYLIYSGTCQICKMVQHDSRTSILDDTYTQPHLLSNALWIDSETRLGSAPMRE